MPLLVDVQLIREWVLEAGRMALSQSSNRNFDLKPDHTPVTKLDQQIELFLLDQIDHHYPGHGVLAEEGSFRPGSDFTWILDPIDGTRAFASRLPIWGISVGVFHQGEPYAGVFYLPMTGEMYWATPEEAFYNEQRLVPVKKVDLHSPLAFIAVPSSVHRHFDISFPRIRSLGSATAHLAYVAYGSATAALSRRIHIWDMAAILPSFKIAHIELIYLNGDSFQPGDLMNGELAAQPLIAAHASVIEEVRSLIKLKPEITGND